MKRYTEGELIQIENKYLGWHDIRELTDYIRKTVGTVEVPQFPPYDAIQRSILRHRRKLARAQVDQALQRHLRLVQREIDRQKGRTRKDRRAAIPECPSNQSGNAGVSTRS